MAEVAVVKTCSNPGCDQPGTKSCSACKTTFYCCVICQTADWTHHKEECPGHLRKMGKAHLVKAEGFEREHNWSLQTLRYAEIAATKLKQLKDRRLDTVQDIDTALRIKFCSLQQLGRQTEAFECAKERYTLWAMNHMRNPGSMTAAFALIQSCIHKKKIEDAILYAREAMFMINMADNFIPADQRQEFLADGSYYLALAIFNLARDDGIPPDEKKKAGEETIELARQALENYSQLFGTGSTDVAGALLLLADSLDHFNDNDDDEIFRLREQAIANYSRVQGSSSPNVGICKNSLGNAYDKRANRAQAADDLDRYVVNEELALIHHREAARILRANNHMDKADAILGVVARTEEKLGCAYGKIADSAHAAKDLDRCLANLELSLPHFREALRIFQANNISDGVNEVLRKIAQIESNIRRVAIITAAAPSETRG